MLNRKNTLDSFPAWKLKKHDTYVISRRYCDVAVSATGLLVQEYLILKMVQPRSLVEFFRNLTESIRPTFPIGCVFV